MRRYKDRFGMAYSFAASETLPHEGSLSLALAYFRKAEKFMLLSGTSELRLHGLVMATAYKMQGKGSSGAPGL